MSLYQKAYKKTLMITATLILSTGAAFSQADSHDRGRKGGLSRMAAELNLTEEQKQQAKAIQQKYQLSQEERAKARELHLKLREAKQANNTAELERLKQERGALMKESRASRIAQREEIRALLTPEQQTKFSELQKKRNRSR